MERMKNAKITNDPQSNGNTTVENKKNLPSQIHTYYHANGVPTPDFGEVVGKRKIDGGISWIYY